MPTEMSASAATALHGSMTAPSARRIAERITPKTGFMNPKTETRDTGFTRSRSDQSEYAAAEMKPM